MDRYSEIVALPTRLSTLIRRRYPQLRHMVPHRAVRLYTRARSVASEKRRLYMRPVATVPYTNVFHCCVQKTGSQWVMSLFSDPVIYRYSGLSHYQYQSRGAGESRRVADRTFTESFPAGSIVSPLYISHENFAALPKAGDYRAFFVMRDPRDLIVSWYFSTKATHLVEKDTRLAEDRATLVRLPKQEGLRHAVDFCAADGRFDVLRSWAQAGDERVRLVKYEDLTGPDGRDEFARLLAFLEIPLADAALDRLWESYSFRRLTGREPGSAKESSHLRSGRSGDWKNHLDDDTVAYLDTVTGGLPSALGYADA